MSKTAALFLGLDGSAWLAGRHVHLPDDVVTLLQAAAAERDELLAEAREGRGVLHTDTDKPRQPPADGALMLYDRSQSRFFRSKDGLAWDVDVHNPIVATTATLNCYYSVESEPRADGTRMHRRTYWLKDDGARRGGDAARRGIALVQYRVLREDQTRRRCTKRPRPSAPEPSAPRPKYPWEASFDASLARLHEALLHSAAAPSPGLAGAASPLQYLNDKILSMRVSFTQL